MSAPPRTPGHPFSRATAANATTTMIAPTTTASTSASAAPRLSTAASSQKPRQLSHLHSQLAQLTAHVADLENLLRMTAVQAESMRGLGGYAGGMFMAASKVLGEETITGAGLGADNGSNAKTSADAKVDTNVFTEKER
ncbi:MAG: hypothetical protein M1822_005340 [Bathelium mastoideum]|nr:MAG: hypothetical protein M1822_005340 [Bathelium mastoideum]